MGGYWQSRWFHTPEELRSIRGPATMKWINIEIECFNLHHSALYGYMQWRFKGHFLTTWRWCYQTNGDGKPHERP